MAYINGKMTEFEHYVEINNIKFEDVTGNDGKIIKQESLLQAVKKDTAMFVNLSIMMYLWLATSVSYYTINFYLKYLKGNMFNNSNIAALAECFSLFLAGGIYLKFGL